MMSSLERLTKNITSNKFEYIHRHFVLFYRGNNWQTAMINDLLVYKSAEDGMVSETDDSMEISAGEIM